MNVWDIRNAAVNEEIDYLFLMDILKNYSRPRDKITRLLKNKDLIRVKKGLYLFGEKYAKGPYVKETLANLIYGPSCISLEYALGYYGLIPERVEVITSITSQRDKQFQTPVGIFSYRYLHSHKYPIGITCAMLDETHSVLIATPEKALADIVMLEKQKLFQWDNLLDVAHYLHDDLRISVNNINGLDVIKLKMIAQTYQNKNVNMLVSYISQLCTQNKAK